MQDCAFYEAVAWCRIKESEQGRAYSTHGKHEECIKVMVGNIEGRRLLGGLGVGGRSILR
jgi:hypothetical protein